MTQNDTPEFKTGIYRHFKGKLYFAEGLEMDADFNEERYRVQYWALYPGQNLPFSKSFEKFMEVLAPLSPGSPRRFTLIRKLPVEKMGMILPGTSVEDGNYYPYNVEAVEEIKGEICVRLQPDELFPLEPVLLKTFFRDFELT